MTEAVVQARHLSVTAKGGLEHMVLRTTRLAEPGPDEAVVRVEAAGVSYGDLLLRLGVIPGGPKTPFTPGYDFAGVVEQVGREVSGLAIGQDVAALVPTGGYADRVLINADRLVPRPAGAPAIESAAAALNYFIAYQMLHRVAEVKAGQRILVHGASGGVGVAFLELARMAGVECYGTASAPKQDLVSSLGAHPIDYKGHDFVKVIRSLPGGTVHAVFDPIGGGHFNRSSSVLAKGGILVGYGQNAALVDGKPNKLVGARGFLGGILLPNILPNGKRSVFYNAWSLEKSHPHAYREDLATVLRLLAEGKVSPPVARTLPLEMAADGQRMLENGSVTGKIVLTTGA
jgi:NADPH:quinone reductase-like Zn-dependent oxidoreductase